MMLYVASDSELPLIAWNKKQPAFNVTSLGRFSQRVRTQFSKPNICCVGAHTGCSCGFLDSQNEPEAHEALRQLSNYLSSALETTDSLQLFSCWVGDEDAKPETRQTLTPQDFARDNFVFDELQFFTVIK